MKLCLLASLTALVGACVPPGPAPSPPPDGSDAAAPDACPPPDAAPAVDAGPDDCERAGMRLEELQCRDELGAPLWVGPTGESFAERCRKDALRMGWDVACVAEIENCDQLKRAATGELCTPSKRPLSLKGVRL